MQGPKLQLDMKLIEKKYITYQSRPELYLLSKIEKHNPWPQHNLGHIQIFLEQITALYNSIPYHNITHAFDVMVVLNY